MVTIILNWAKRCLRSVYQGPKWRVHIDQASLKSAFASDHHSACEPLSPLKGRTRLISEIGARFDKEASGGCRKRRSAGRQQIRHNRHRASAIIESISNPGSNYGLVVLPQSMWTFLLRCVIKLALDENATAFYAACAPSAVPLLLSPD